MIRRWGNMVGCGSLIAAALFGVAVADTAGDSAATSSHPADQAPVADETPVVDEAPIDRYDRDHWSFQPLVRPAVPEIPSPASDLSAGASSSDKPTSLSDNPIDRFVNAQLKAAGLAALPPADPVTLLRRLKYDLVGLPPTPAEVQQILANRSPAAYEQLVDRLLASPAYGEKWAQHWLDLARFAETDGFEHDKPRSDAWRYRDWVNPALNQDMPYDQFLRWQIAGDELQPNNPDAVTATAFCLSGPDMPDINSQVERKHNLLNELTATVGSVVLGLQLGCAECHDHKFDPISQADFYRMRAIFQPAVHVEKNKSIFALDNGTEADPGYVMIRGDYRRPGAPIEPGFVRIANPQQREITQLARSGPLGRRSELAEWLTQPDHPLTTRVLVNRVWQHHFGRGICASSSDFGVMGDYPTHPDLLDWLATEFVRLGWRMKPLHRLIVTSQTYRRASRTTEPGWTEAQRRQAAIAWEKAVEEDATNALLARFPRRRLSGETIRDAMLAVSGSLNRQAHGPSVMPPLPPEMVSTLLKNQWKNTENTDQHFRRSIYVFARRNLRFPIFAAFDRPGANTSCACRNESTTANQSLLMLNGKPSLAAAQRLAQIALAECDGSPLDAAQQAFLRCFGRAMTAAEIETVGLFLQPADADSTEPALNVVDVCLGLLNANEFIYID